TGAERRAPIFASFARRRVSVGDFVVTVLAAMFAILLRAWLGPVRELPPSHWPDFLVRDNHGEVNISYRKITGPPTHGRGVGTFAYLARHGQGPRRLAAAPGRPTGPARGYPPAGG